MYIHTHNVLLIKHVAGPVRATSLSAEQYSQILCPCILISFITFSHCPIPFPGNPNKTPIKPSPQTMLTYSAHLLPAQWACLSSSLRVCGLDRFPWRWIPSLGPTICGLLAQFGNRTFSFPAWSSLDLTYHGVLSIVCEEINPIYQESISSFP